MKNRIKIFIFVSILLVISGVIYIANQQYTKPEAQTEKTSLETENTSPQIVSTTPSPLNDTIVLPNQVIEVTFNYPLIDEFETRTNIEPKIEYKEEFSNDKKTLRIIQAEPYQVGKGYTLSINLETKFHNGQTFGRNESFSFKTIDHKGI